MELKKKRVDEGVQFRTKFTPGVFIGVICIPREARAIGFIFLIFWNWLGLISSENLTELIGFNKSFPPGIFIVAVWLTTRVLVPNEVFRKTCFWVLLIDEIVIRIQKAKVKTINVKFDTFDSENSSAILE